MRNRLQQVGTMMLTAVGVVALFAIARAQGGNRDVACIQNARRLAIGVAQYASDYDNQFPLMRNPEELREATLPYVRDPAVFFCPVTRTAFAPNPALSGQSISTFGNDYSTIAVLSDAVTHANGQPTIAFLDGHVERGGVDPDPGDPNEICVDNARRLSLAVVQYINDYDDFLPPMQNAETFRTAVSPYVRGRRVFLCPDTQIPYTPNAVLSNQPYYNIPDPNLVELLRDAQPHRDGLTTVAYLSGRVERGNARSQTTTGRRSPRGSSHAHRNAGH